MSGPCLIKSDCIRAMRHLPAVKASRKWALQNHEKPVHKRYMFSVWLRTTRRSFGCCRKQREERTMFALCRLFWKHYKTQRCSLSLLLRRAQCKKSRMSLIRFMTAENRQQQRSCSFLSQSRAKPDRVFGSKSLRTACMSVSWVIFKGDTKSTLRKNQFIIIWIRYPYMAAL